MGMFHISSLTNPMNLEPLESLRYLLCKIKSYLWTKGETSTIY